MSKLQMECKKQQMLSIKKLSIDMKFQDISTRIKKERNPIMKKFNKKLCNIMKFKKGETDLRVVIHPNTLQSTHPKISMKLDMKRTIIITRKLSMMFKLLMLRTLTIHESFILL